MLRLCIAGLGRTGKEIAKLALEIPDIKVVMALCSINSDKRGKDLGEVCGVRDTGIIVDCPENLEHEIIKHQPQVVIDFTNPLAALHNAEIFAKMNVNMIIGTTGFSQSQQNKLANLAREHKVGIVLAPNITLGVNVLMLLANLATSILDSYDVEILEYHHKHKLDKPSGTAKKLAGEITKLSRLNNQKKDINVHAIRAGGIVGLHKVIVAGENDRIEIIHESFSRRVFAEGAIKAAYFVRNKAGFFEMRDVLNLEQVLSNCLAMNDYLVENIDSEEVVG
ncbi:MAG TPA: 4-hydroxy-tetrahydrodipicolinate reductase [Clostridia bacterium]|nr:4-hydroxy-tetrahydrodipicolinate reductase [Clostridia bacterium]